MIISLHLSENIVKECLIELNHVSVTDRVPYLRSEYDLRIKLYCYPTNAPNSSSELRFYKKHKVAKPVKLQPKQCCSRCRRSLDSRFLSHCLVLNLQDWKFSKARLTNEPHVAFKIPYLCDYITKRFRQQAEIVPKPDNKSFRNIGHAETQHVECKRLKFDGGEAYTSPVE